MRILAYSYSDPLFETRPDPSIWGWEVDRVYQDLGNRQQMYQLFQDFQSHPSKPEAEPDYLLVRRLEELGDSVAEVSDRLTQLEQLGVRLIATEDPHDLGDRPSRSDLLHLIKVVQEQQRSRKLKHSHAQRRIQALPPPGKAPYGYRRGKERYLLDRSTAPVVKDFFDHFLLYGSLRSSVRYLQQRYRKQISVSTGKRWLSSAVYRGDLVYPNGEVLRDTHVPILSRDEAAQIDRLLRRNQKLPPRSASAPRSLSGLLSCAACQLPLTISRVKPNRTAPEYLYLRAPACPHQPKCKAIPYALILDRVIQQICQELPLAIAAAPLPNVEGIKQGITTQIEARQTILTQLPDLVDSGILDPETAALRRYKVQTEIAALQIQVAQLPPPNLLAIAQLVSIPQFWLDLSEPERRFYFREFIRQIQIHRDGGEWRIAIDFIF
ncbi:MAG: recombinase family protein [Oculatellaceae cyanobacterium Prado106]|nr:recombinase family protein [Oculatellaceae cyanobacterium Prado106]